MKLIVAPVRRCSCWLQFRYRSLIRLQTNSVNPLTPHSGFIG